LEDSLSKEILGDYIRGSLWKVILGEGIITCGHFSTKSSLDIFSLFLVLPSRENSPSWI
jgi:hypothetical protein